MRSLKLARHKMKAAPVVEDGVCSLNIRVWIAMQRQNSLDAKLTSVWRCLVWLVLITILNRGDSFKLIGGPGCRLRPPFSLLRLCASRRHISKFFPPLICSSVPIDQRGRRCGASRQMRCGPPPHRSDPPFKRLCSGSALERRLKPIRRFFTVQSVTEICLPLTEAELMRRR